MVVICQRSPPRSSWVLLMPCANGAASSALRFESYALHDVRDVAEHLRGPTDLAREGAGLDEARSDLLGKVIGGHDTDLCAAGRRR
jgi:hypothetical protein